MRKRTLFSIAAVVVILACGWAAAGERLADLPRRHSAAAQDRQPVTATLDSGAAWSAWAYRISGEYAIALSFRDPDGVWSEPSFIGLDDRLDQIAPTIAADAEGNLYLGYAVRETGEIFVSATRAGTQRWFEPQRVTNPDERAGSPTFRVVGDSLVMGYRAGREIRLLDWPLLTTYSPGGGMTTEGIQDGPDGFPLAVLHNGQDDDEDNDEGDREETNDDGDESGGRADRLGMR
jgi:hypothetical protein